MEYKINNYQRINILFWITAKMSRHFLGWWGVHNYGPEPDKLYKYDYNTIFPQTEYYFPVVEQLDNFLKLLVPPSCFTYQGYNINSYWDFTSQRYYCWTQDQFSSAEPSIKKISKTQECLQCGWYCQQTCHTWNPRDFLL